VKSNLRLIFFLFFSINFNCLARTKSLVDHFEGDIGPVKLIKKINMKNADQTSECKPICDEAIQINMIGNEKFLVNI
jgi:hypothetical protein